MQFAVVPGALALLPEYAGQLDPVADLRTACTAALAPLGDAAVLASTPQAVRVGRHLLVAAGHGAAGEPPEQWSGPFVVVANGSAKRSDKAPGHFDPRAAEFDADLVARLQTGELAGLDLALAGELWADVEALAQLDGLVEIDPDSVETGLISDPYGVLYAVVTGRGSRR